MQHLLLRDEGLATRLRHARGEMMAKELAERAGWVQSKVSKIESGKQLASRDDLATWARLTGADPATLELWNAMLTEALQARRDWTARMRAGGQESVQQSYSDMVQAAVQLRFFETAYIPRFFQVPGYTRGVLTWVNQRVPEARDVEKATAIRQADVKYLYTDKRFDLLITEPVLYWRHVSMSADTMRQQLDRLLTVDGLANVRFGILPLRTAHKVWPEHSFEIYGETLMLETLFGEQEIRDEEILSKYHQILDQTWETAATGDRARELIHDAIRALPRT